MDRFHVIRHPLGGSDIFDSSGKQVGYSLPSVFGDGEDFYDLDGNPVGQSFDDSHGMSDFLGVGNGTYGYMDQEILMGRNAWLHGNPFEKEEEPDMPGLGEMPGTDSFDGDFDPGDSFGSGPDGGDSGPDF